MITCQKPTAGWACSRTAGHDGPCAARPTKWITLKNRLRCVYWMLTSKSFILLHHIGELREGELEGRRFRIALRTEYSDHSDAYTLTAAATDHARKYARELLVQPLSKGGRG
jgi:hypothetical protein